MASGTESVEVSSQLVFSWRIEGINTQLEKAKAGEDVQLYSPIVSDLPWTLNLVLAGSDATANHAGVYLLPRVVASDYNYASAMHQSGRKAPGWKIELLDTNLAKAIAVSKHEADTFQGTMGWGRSSAFALSNLEVDSIKEKNCCVLRCTFEHTQPLPAPVQRDFAFDLFDNRDYADLVFRIKPNAAAAPSYLFALKLLLQKRSPYLKTLISSGFEESSSFINLDPPSCGQTSTPLIGDGADFAAFEAALLPPAKSPSPAQRGKPAARPSIAAATAPHKKRKTNHLVFTFRKHTSSAARGGAPSPEQEEKIEVEGRDSAGEDMEVKDAVEEEDVNEEEEEATEEDEELQSAGGASAGGDEEEEQEDGGRSFQVIDISGRSFATYRALIYFLHTGMTNFTPSVSNYLVNHHKVLEKNKDHNVEPRNSWLVKKSFRKDPPPCNPHALYRLADEYLDDKLRDLAKGFICRSLTVENVAYEAFCQLSIDYEDFQKDVLKFLLEHWDKVKTTKGMKHALELLEAGQLPGGAGVLTKIHEGLVAKK